MRIAIILAIHRKLPSTLQKRAVDLAFRAVNDMRHEFAVFLDFREETDHTSTSPWSRLCRVADKAVKSVDLSLFDYVFWTDSDVVDYPQDICHRLIEANPNGVTAPLPLIEDSARLYDTAACIIKGGESVFSDTPGLVFGRNLEHEHPYWPVEPTVDFVEMDCVGMCFISPASIVAAAGVPDHPAFTGWYGICRAARDDGRKVGILRSCIAYHAELPRYGIMWH